MFAQKHVCLGCANLDFNAELSEKDASKGLDQCTLDHYHSIKSDNFSTIVSFLLVLTFGEVIITAWIFHGKDIAILQAVTWLDFYCSWETAGLLWRRYDHAPSSSFSLSAEFLLTLTQTSPGNAFPLSSGQIAFYCLDFVLSQCWSKTCKSFC